jgi:hypothetical protein
MTRPGSGGPLVRVRVTIALVVKRAAVHDRDVHPIGNPFEHVYE